MINPQDYKVDDFTAELSPHMVAALKCEDLHGSELIDNLILLRFLDKDDVKKVLEKTYRIPFAWLKIDPTPPDLAPIAQKYGVLLQRTKDTVVCYLPLGQALDNATLQVDIPNYRLRYVCIADANYRLIKKGLEGDIISMQIANFRPLLVYRRLVIDCSEHGATDLHFQSVFDSKLPSHHIRYRINKEMIESSFTTDLEMIQQMCKAVVGKLTTASAADIDSADGISTQVPDLFRDGTVDIRFQCDRTEAGMVVDSAINHVTTTTMTIDQLGFPKEDVAMLRELANLRTGLTLVTGEMRSGKNTTIMAMVNELHQVPINIVEYSNPVEVHMEHVQFNYRGDLGILLGHMKKAKKYDIDIAILNEIPNAEVAFAVRDLVNSAIGVITTTHINRIWHAPAKLNEFFARDYKTIISQLNVVINHKMFRRWSGPGMVKRVLQPDKSAFDRFAYRCGVRQYFVPQDASRIKYRLQPLCEILVITSEMKTAMLNFEEMWRAEQMLQTHIEREHGTLENKLANYINQGICSLEEMRKLFHGG